MFFNASSYYQVAFKNKLFFRQISLCQSFIYAEDRDDTTQEKNKNGFEEKPAGDIFNNLQNVKHNYNCTCVSKRDHLCLKMKLGNDNFQAARFLSRSYKNVK